MTITGLENNYYLSQNDIWIAVNGFAGQTAYLDFSAGNTTSQISLQPVRMYPSPSNDYGFNISEIIRAVQPEPDQINVNSLQAYSLTFTATMEDGTQDSQTFSKYFIRGGRDKFGTAEWYLNDGDSLIVGRWVNWSGIALPGYAKKINGGLLTDYFPKDFYLVNRSNCDYRIVKFLNSLGAYQYFVFDNWEYKNKPKQQKTTDRTTYRLRDDNFRSLGSDDDRSIELYAKSPFEIQEVFEDLTRSIDVYLYNPDGTDSASKWERLQPESTESVRNNYERVYDNKISLTVSNYYSRRL